MKIKIKSILIILVLTTMTLSLFGQEKLKVAVFDPMASGTGLDEGTGLAVRELISSTIVNTGKYTIIERAMIQQIIKEQKFSNSDIVDESQAAEIGKLAGADKIVLSAVSLVGGRNMLSIKMTDVKTATIDAQKTKICQSNDLLDVIEPLTNELLGETAIYRNQALAEQKAKEEKTLAEQKAKEEKTLAEQKTRKEKLLAEQREREEKQLYPLVFDGGKIFQRGNRLSKNEIRGIMAGTDALRIYNKGISKSKKGNTLITIGTIVLAFGILTIYPGEPPIPEIAIVAGTAMLLPGIILKVQSKRDIKKSVGSWNNSDKIAELKCNFTGNGVKFTLSF